MEKPRYRHIADFLISEIQKGQYGVGDLLPSEHELCRQFAVTRTTARKALEILTQSGFIERVHGLGSRVAERRKSLGLLNVKGFSEAVGAGVSTRMLIPPRLGRWVTGLPFQISAGELSSDCIHFERLRSVGEVPVMLENNWFAADQLPGFADREFVEGSFFKTLSRRYGIEILGSEQVLRALHADGKAAAMLRVSVRDPLLLIDIRFTTSRESIYIYSRLLCNTHRYPIGNSYFL